MGFQRVGRLPQFERLPALFDQGRRSAGRVAGNVLVQQVKRGLVTGPKSGRIYNGIPAGAPGEYSQNRTGQLMSSAGYLVRQPDMFEFGFRAPHAVYQELGTSKMAPRPNLGNANRDAQGRVASVLGSTVFKFVGSP